MTRFILRHPRHRAGFSIIEVLMAMSILAIGIVCIAAIFPVGMRLQQETARQQSSHQGVRGAEAILSAFGIKAETLDATPGNNEATTDEGGATPEQPIDRDGNFQREAFRVYSLWEIDEDVDTKTYPSGDSGADPNNLDPYLITWPLGMRSLPSIQPRAAERTFYFIPLVQRTNYTLDGSAWTAFAFILRREPNMNGLDGQGNPDPDKLYWWDDDEAPAHPEHAADVIGDWANPYDGLDTSTGERFVPGVVRVAVTPDLENNRFDFDNDHWPAGANDGEPDQVRAGDLILADTGIIYRVQFADENGIEIAGRISGDSQSGRFASHIWYGRPANPTHPDSPTVDIRQLSNSTVR